MKIRLQVFSALIVLGCILMMATSVALHEIVIKSVQRMEETDAKITLNGIKKNFDAQRLVLLKNNLDYANWDSTYDFVKNENPGYVGRDFTNLTFVNDDFDLFLVLNENGDVYYYQSDIEGNWTTATVNQITLSRDFVATEKNWTMTGYTILAGMPVILAANSITTSNFTGPVEGSLVWGKVMDSSRIQSLIPDAGTNLTMSLESSQGDQSEKLTTQSESQLLGTLHLNSTLPGFIGLTVSAVFQRTIYNETLQAVNSFLLTFICIYILLTILYLHIFDQGFIKSVNRITSQINKLNVQSALKPINYNASDEITPLITGFNMLLNEVENYKTLLKENERLVAIGQTSNMVGHDLRNPLQTIMLTNYLLKKELAGELYKLHPQTYTKIMDQLDSLDQQTAYMDKIVGNIQTYATITQPKFEKCDLLQLAKNVISMMSIPQEIKIKIQENSNLPPVSADPNTLKRVFNNLILNAIQAMPEGGPINIYSEKIDGNVKISIKDSGPGISNSVKENLFKPFYSTKAKGTGLGLAVSKKIIESHGGIINLESTNGSGCRFYFILPIDHEEIFATTSL
jgi:signal transduction histidine kinase